MNEYVYSPLPVLEIPIYSFASYEAMLNTIQMQSHRFQYFRNFLAMKKNQRKVQPNQSRERRLQALHLPERTQSPFIPQNQVYSSNQHMCEATSSRNYAYQQNYNYSSNDCPQMPTPQIIRPCFPIVIPSLRPIYTPHLPLVRPNVRPILPILPETFHEDVSNVSISTNIYTNYPDQSEPIAGPSNEETYSNKDEEIPTGTSTVDTSAEVQSNKSDDIEYYLKLPKDTFPSPKMPTFDSNLIIDEFCKLKNIQHHLPWILDLEFGIPKIPVTRPIPVYNVIYNNIFCKDAPNEIHPDFESCDDEFKSVLLFYYDCIVSAWYRGYIALYGDDSVENFQSWLQLPMQVLGMSWS